MAISMVPNVGSVVGFVCAQASSMVAKFRSVQDRVNSGISAVNSVSTAAVVGRVCAAAVEGRHVRLAVSIGNVVKKVGNVADKATQTVAKLSPWAKSWRWRAQWHPPWSKSKTVTRPFQIMHLL